MFNYDEQEPLIFTRFFFWGFFAVVLAVFSVVYKQRACAQCIALLRQPLLLLEDQWSLRRYTAVQHHHGLSHRSLERSALRSTGRETAHGSRSASPSNLLVLGFFKYAHFVVDNINALLGTTFHPVNIFAHWANLAWDAHFVENKILLPVGISFYTFQTMSYAIDVYRDDVKPVRNLLDFGFYVSFFPQLVAGPIVRASEFIPQLYQEYKLTKAQFGIALFWILNGLGEEDADR